MVLERKPGLHGSLGTIPWSEDAKGGWQEELITSIKRNTERYRTENDITQGGGCGCA